MNHRARGPLFSESDSIVSLVVLIAFASLLMVADRRLGYLQQLREHTLNLFLPLHQVVDWPAQWGRSLSLFVFDRQELIDELQLRERELLHSRAEASELRTRLEALKRIQDLTEASAPDPRKKLVARTLAVDLDSHQRRFLIDRGRDDGVIQGSVVFDGLGIVGQISELGQHSARAIMLSDSSQAIPVEVERTGVRAIASGSGEIRKLILEDLPINIDLQVGDVLRSSGLGGVYARGYLVATVTEIHRSSHARYARAKALASAQLDHLDEVLVIPPVVVEGPPDPP